MYSAGDLVSPGQFFDSGAFLVPEDRRRSGIVEIHSIKAKMMMAVWDKYRSRVMLINDNKASAEANGMKESLHIRCTGIEQEVQSLSGGNQQKVVFAKGLMTKPKVLLLDEPTVGVDVEAKSAIANLIRDIAENGSGVLIVSSEMSELARLCNRIILFDSGSIKGELIRGRDEISEISLNEKIQS